MLIWIGMSLALTMLRTVCVSSDTLGNSWQAMQWMSAMSTADSPNDMANLSQSALPLDIIRLLYKFNEYNGFYREMTQEQVLLRTLLRRYNSVVRPASLPGNVTSVTISLALSQITDIDMRHQKMVSMFWSNQQWVDHRLRWNPDNFFGIKEIRIYSSSIWIPDIVLYNSVEGNPRKAKDTKTMIAIISHNGKIFYGPVVLYHSFCRLDVTYFPFDYQFCWLKLGSWAHTGDVLDVSIGGNGIGIDTSGHLGNGEWELLDTRGIKNVKFYPCCPDPFPELFFYFRFRRRILYYAFSVLAPCVIMSSVAMFAFCLPTECSEKVTLGLTVLLAYTVFQLTIAESMPKTSEFLAYISVYFTIVILTTSMTVFSTIMVVSVKESGRIRETYPPRKLLQLLAFFKLIPLDLIRSCDVYTPSKNRKKLLKACCGLDEYVPRFENAIFVHKQPAVFEFKIRDDLNLLGSHHTPFCRLQPLRADEDFFRSNRSLLDLEIYPKYMGFADPAVEASNRLHSSAEDIGDVAASLFVESKSKESQVVLEANAYSSTSPSSARPRVCLVEDGNNRKRAKFVDAVKSSYSWSSHQPNVSKSHNLELSQPVCSHRTKAMHREVEKAAIEIRTGIERLLYHRNMTREWVAVYVAIDTLLFYLFVVLHLINTFGFLIVVPLMVPSHSLNYLIDEHLATVNITV